MGKGAVRFVSVVGFRVWTRRHQRVHRVHHWRAGGGISFLLRRPVFRRLHKVKALRSLYVAKLQQKDEKKPIKFEWINNFSKINYCFHKAQITLSHCVLIFCKDAAEFRLVQPPGFYRQFILGFTLRCLRASRLGFTPDENVMKSVRQTAWGANGVRVPTRANYFCTCRRLKAAASRAPGGWISRAAAR